MLDEAVTSSRDGVRAHCTSAGLCRTRASHRPEGVTEEADAQRSQDLPSPQGTSFVEALRYHSSLMECKGGQRWSALGGWHT